MRRHQVDFNQQEPLYDILRYIEYTFQTERTIIANARITEIDLRILIIEDEKKITDALQELCRIQEIDCDIANDGEEGLLFAMNPIYDVIVLDIMLPLKSGTEILQTMRDNENSTPVLMLTAKGTVDDKVKCLDMGADDYLVKPFSAKELFARIRAAHPDHYDDIFNAIAQYPGAIREWLEDYPLHPEFDPDGHAPMTDAKSRMIDMARSDDEDELEEVIAESKDPEVNSMLLNVGRLRDISMDSTIGVPYGPKLSNFLSSKGFVYVGRARGANGKQARYWSRHPDVVVKPNLQAWIDDFIELATLKV